VSWFSANRDSIGIVLALLAVVISFTTVIIGRLRQQASGFLAVQGMMLAEDLWRGRLMIHQAGMTGSMPSTDLDDVYLMVRALAVVDLMCSYARRHIIRYSWVLEYWHPRLQVLRHGYDVVNSFEHGSYPNHDRPDLLDLVARAESYRCTRVCCANGKREQRLANATRRPKPEGSAA
jgi:hypothetical protein